MPRKKRIEKIGFYHIVNRGVARNNVYLFDEDFLKFLDIVQNASDEYRFEVYSYCLMDNHYHLLLKMSHQNLSLVMQKVNSRYTIYFNNKYKRVGPLWQGRFKSWFVFDENYLHTLVRYIEFNPIKAGIKKDIGEYKWAMSSKNVEFSMLNFELLENINFEKELDETELQKIEELYHTKIEQSNNQITKKEIVPIHTYFQNLPKEQAIWSALKNGYKATDIASYLHLSNPAITKIVKLYKQKIALFEKIKNKGLFWSYRKDATYEEIGGELLMEYTMKYGDFDDMKLGIELFGKKHTKIVWEKTMQSDQHFIKTNLLIARVFFGMDVEADYFKEMKNARFEKLKLLAS